MWFLVIALGTVEDCSQEAEQAGGLCCVEEEGSPSMEVNYKVPLAVWGIKVVLALFKHVLRAQFGHPMSGVMAQDSSGHPGPEIH